MNCKRKTKTTRIAKTTYFACKTKKIRLVCKTKLKTICLIYQIEIVCLTCERQLTKQEELRILNKNNRTYCLIDKINNCQIEIDKKFCQQDYKKQFEQFVKNYIYRVQVVLKLLNNLKICLIFQ